MNRRRLFGMLTATAGAVAVSQVPQPARAQSAPVVVDVAGQIHAVAAGYGIDPASLRESVRILQWAPRMGLSNLDMAEGTKFNDRSIKADHVCQCFTCNPDTLPPAMKADRANAKDGTVWDVLKEQGHFSPFFGRPSTSDFRNGVRMKVWINGIPFDATTHDMAEVIAGENGGVWSFTRSPQVRHICQTCLHDACVTVYRGRVEVDVMVPEGYTPDIPLRMLMTG